jgi:divalent metal cation (Fe/Co/Zn/Cd) transporter
VGLAFTFILKLPVLDVITGLLISLFIIKSAVTIFMESSVGLMDGVKDETIYDKIFEAVDRVSGASNPHRVRSRQIGSLYTVVLDIEADGNITLTEAHHIADEVEESIRSAVENIYDIVVHVEPCGACHAEEKFGINKSRIE